MLAVVGAGGHQLSDDLATRLGLMGDDNLDDLRVAERCGNSETRLLSSFDRELYDAGLDPGRSCRVGGVDPNFVDVESRCSAVDLERPLEEEVDELRDGIS